MEIIDRQRTVANQNEFFGGGNTNPGRNCRPLLTGTIDTVDNVIPIPLLPVGITGACGGAIGEPRILCGIGAPAAVNVGTRWPVLASIGDRDTGTVPGNIDVWGIINDIGLLGVGN
jgi:hypothetical protein